MNTTDNRTPPQILKVKYINNHWLDLHLETQLSIQLQYNCLSLVEFSTSQLVKICLILIFVLAILIELGIWKNGTPPPFKLGAKVTFNLVESKYACTPTKNSS